MMESMYQWVRNLSVYLVLTTVILHALPDTDYTPYIRFYLGLVMMVLVLTPIFHVLDMQPSFDTWYQSKEYEAYLREVEEVKSYLGEVWQSQSEELSGEVPE